MRDNDTSRAESLGVFETAKNLAASIVAHLHTRLELLSTEIAEEKLRLTSLLYSTFMAIFFLFTTLMLGLLFVIAAYWDTPYRLHAIGGLAIVSLIVAGVAGSRVRAQLKAGPRLFEASLAELYKDRQHLESRR